MGLSARAILFIALMSCSSSKNRIAFTEVQQGAHLGKAKEVNLGTFLSAWIQNVDHSKVDFNLNKLFEDSTFTYFGKQTFKDQYFYKIRTDNLTSVDYISIHGDAIREKFYYEIIPNKDRNKQNNCSTALIALNYTYRFIENENSIEIKCHYKVGCEYILKIIDKDYMAKYNIQEGTLEKL